MYYLNVWYCVYLPLTALVCKILASSRFILALGWKKSEVFFRSAVRIMVDWVLVFLRGWLCVMLSLCTACLSRFLIKRMMCSVSGWRMSPVIRNVTSKQPLALSLSSPALTQSTEITRAHAIPALAAFIPLKIPHSSWLDEWQRPKPSLLMAEGSL